MHSRLSYCVTKPLYTRIQELNNQTIMPTATELQSKGYDNAVLIDPPPGAIDRLTKALAKAQVEGRGKRSIGDIQIQFFNADSPYPGARNTQTYAYIEVASGASLVSGYALWEPQGTDEVGKALYDCYTVANEINAL